MPSLFNFLIILTVLELVQYSDGNQRIVDVSDLISDNEDFIASGEDDNNQICCVYGNCSCSSLNQALANLTSNVLINITTNVTLSSLVIIPDIVNVTVIGHNNPTVNCKDFGRVHFTSCDNCAIQGITWDGCGTDDHTEPGLKLSNSSNINIKNSLFRYSKGQALLLSEITGDVNIDHCDFVYNSHYKGHGVAIHYSSSNVTNGSVFTISDCNFAYNSANSLVYTENNISKHKNNISFCSAKFCHNQGVSVYAANENIILNGKIVFHNNTAEEGTGIYISDHSTVTFGETSDVTFTQNSAAKFSGGTIFLRDYSNVIFDKFSMVIFNNNKAFRGGTIYSKISSNITFKANCKVTFSDNSAKVPKVPISGYGGAIYSTRNSCIIFEGSSSLVFSNNIAKSGGAVFSDDHSHILFKGNSSPLFHNNDGIYGTAIFSFFFSRISFAGNSSPVFSNNDDSAIYSYHNSYITFEENSSPVFSNNTAMFGGAIFSNYQSHTIFKGNSSAVFDNNTVTNDGGAIHTLDSNVSFAGFSTVVFRNNIAEYGGAVSATRQSDIIFSDYSTVTFTNNSATFGASTFSNTNSTIIATGNSTVMFNDRSAKWCNSTCLPYTGQGDVVIIDSNGIVWCSDQKVFVCVSKECDCNKLEDLLDGLESNTLVNITNTVTLSSVITLEYLNNVSIIGYNNVTVNCVNGGGLRLWQCSNLIIEGITWIRCGNYNNTNDVPVIHLTMYYYHISMTTIQKCTFQYSLGNAISLDHVSRISNTVIIDNCNFTNNNHYRGHGAAIFLLSHYYKINLNITNCNFHYNGEAESIIYFDFRFLGDYRLPYSIHLNTSSFCCNQGTSVYLFRAFILHINGEVLIENNIAESGAGIYINNNSTVIFDENSNVKFINNSVDHNGAAIFTNDFSNVIFEQNSIMTFQDNKATRGTIYCKDNSNVTFKSANEVTFSGNLATQYGAAIYSSDNSHVTFTENSKVTFSDNVVSSTNTKNGLVLQHCGTIYSENNSSISFEDKSFAMFTNNVADYGAAIFSYSNSFITFKHSSRVMFNNNIAEYCGVLTSILFSSIIYTDNTEVSYNGNIISCTSTSNNYNYETSVVASAMCIFQRSVVIYSGHSLVSYTSNTAGGGGAISSSDSNVIIKELSTVSFNNNVAQSSSGGAFTCYNNSNITIKNKASVTFNSNKASQDGGAIYSFNICKITFKDNSTSTFVNNVARNNGGAVLSSQLSEITFEGNSTIIFDYNTADNGGVFYFNDSKILFNESSKVSFYNNEARQDGGAGYICSASEVTFGGISAVRFDNNKAFYGGAIFAIDNSNITVTSNSELSFTNNEAAQSGGAGYVNSHCNFIIKENAMVTFDNNRAMHGGAVCIDNNITLTFKGSSTAFINNNVANEGGGAIKVKDSNVTLKENITIKFINNSAQYGGAIFLDTTAVLFSSTDMNFINNNARIMGSSVYQHLHMCKSSCVDNRITGITNKLIAAPPNELKFDDPAVCIDNNNNTECSNYYIQNIMLGGEIVVPVCLLDYYNQSVDSIQFLVQSEINGNYFISGANHVVISCDKFTGISIIGNHSLSKSTNFSITITLNTALYSNWSQISVNLIIELSPCHPGFWQYANSLRCECYNANDIVFCSGSSSTIKRGYWFGSVTGRPTVTFCPINYCSFSCCETSNGYYHLSPVRDNQCRSHRSGTACGSCADGYTLSYDSTECVSIDSCTAGQTVSDPVNSDILDSNGHINFCYDVL